jgi:hypothetical protein
MHTLISAATLAGPLLLGSALPPLFGLATQITAPSVTASGASVYNWACDLIAAAGAGNLHTG